MSTFRINKTKNFTVISNIHLKEKKMSLKAKGLLTLMLSLPEDWDYSIKGLISICVENRSAIRNALDELKEFGYLRIEKLYPDSDRKKIEYEYNIYEVPISIEKRQKKQDSKNQGVENQHLENEDVENQSIENQPQLKTNTLSTKELNTKLLNTYSLFMEEYKSSYGMNKIHRGYEQSSQGGMNKVHRGYEQSSHNNIDNTIVNNIVDTIDYSLFMEKWNELAKGCELSLIESFTENRKKKLSELLEKFTQEEILETMFKIKNINFLLGRTDKSNWKISFDDFLNEDKFMKIMEGSYYDKNKRTSSKEAGKTIEKNYDLW